MVLPDFQHRTIYHSYTVYTINQGTIINCFGNTISESSGCKLLKVDTTVVSALLFSTPSRRSTRNTWEFIYFTVPAPAI